ncbi:MAG TPA: PAS domain-containing protein [Gemmatimonadales bacterium]
MASRADSAPYAGPERRRSVLPGQGAGGSRAAPTQWNGTEEALLAVTQRFELGLEGSGIGIWELELTDGTLQNARIVYTNIFEQLGYGSAEPHPDVPGILELIHPEDRGRIAEAYQAILAGEREPRELEYRLRHRDGSYRTMLMRGVAVYDGDGKPTRIIGSRIDITDRKRAEAALEQSEERFRLATEALASVVYDWDPVRDLVQCFGGLEEILGFRPDEVPQEGAWWRARIHPEDALKAVPLSEAALQGDVPYRVIEYRMQHRDGHYIEVVSRGRIVYDGAGRAVRVVGGLYDVSQRRRLERERETLLESEREARAAAEAAAHERDAVLGIVSHDLGAPLSTIALGASALGSRELPFEVRRKAVDLIDQAVAYMQHLIRDLSDIASIEAGHLALELGDADPAAIVARVAEMLAGAAADRGVGLTTTVDTGLPAIHADAARVLQALTNLVTNAVQFTERGGSVTVRAERDEGGVRFIVEDTGQGISAEDLPHVFDRYWQKRPQANRHGTGLGLAITRGIVEAHGSALQAESTLGVGSRFSFTIPAANQGGGR